VFLNFLAGRFAQPVAEITNAKSKSEEIFKRKIKPHPIPVIIGNGFILGCGLVGFIGMFFLWYIAPFLFAVSIVGKHFSGPYLQVFWSIKNGWETLLGSLELFMDGVILTLVFFGPARPLFFP
jgi:hypothetical protein